MCCFASIPMRGRWRPRRDADATLGNARRACSLSREPSNAVRGRSFRPISTRSGWSRATTWMRSTWRRPLNATIRGSGCIWWPPSRTDRLRVELPMRKSTSCGRVRCSQSATSPSLHRMLFAIASSKSDPKHPSVMCRNRPSVGRFRRGRLSGRSAMSLGVTWPLRGFIRALRTMMPLSPLVFRSRATSKVSNSGEESKRPLLLGFRQSAPAFKGQIEAMRAAYRRSHARAAHFRVGLRYRNRLADRTANEIARGSTSWSGRRFRYQAIRRSRGRERWLPWCRGREDAERAR